LRRLAYLLTMLAGGLATAGLVAPGSLSAADDAPTAVIMLDGSGSMWGRFASDKHSKFEVARDALTEAVPRIRSDVRLGLSSFGHRRRGNCSDAQVITAPVAGDREPVLTPLSKLSPTGKGPLVLGLRQTAEAIGSASPATIILLNDDVDNCGQDLCGNAASIARSNPGLVVHVIGIGLDKAKLASMSCLPRLTGGKLFDAQDAAGLTSSIDQVLKLAHLEPMPEAEQAEKADEPEATAKKLAPNAPPGLYLSAGLGPESATLESPVRWRILKAGAEGELVREMRAPSLVDKKIAPGNYVVEAKLGLASVRQDVEVKPEEPTQVRVDLNAGVLRLIARPAKGGPALATAVFTVTPLGEDGKKAETPIWIGREARPEIVLPAGEYSVSADDGLGHQEQTVKIEPATGTTFDARLATGRLELSAARGSSNDPGEPLAEGVTYIVYEDDPDSPGGRREVTRSAAPSPAFILPAGTYYITVRTDGSEARDQIALGAGDVVRKTLPLGLSRLQLTATLDRDPPPSDLPLTYSVVRLDGEPEEVLRTAASEPQLELAAGRYKLEAELGTTNVKTAGEIALRAGQDQKAALRLQAGEVTLNLAEGVGTDVFWEVKDDQNQTVFRSARAHPTALLAPGRYTVEAETRERQLRAAFELKAGESRTLEIGG